MKTKHTPGPWVVAYGQVYRAEPSPTCENAGICIAKPDRNEPHTSPCERDANARLIAAAPELAEALRKTLYSLTCARERLHIKFEIPAETQARAVLAKLS